MTADLPSIAKIAELLGGDLQGAEVLCPGPGHSAGDRSLSVKPDPTDREGFVTHSFADDDWKVCRAYVRERLGLSERKPGSQSKIGGGKWTQLAEYVYRDQNGEPFLIVRKCRDGTGRKQFPQFHWDGNRWVKGKPDGPKIPYRLPQLIAAPTMAPVYFCEGEKDADTLAKIGFVATTASEGAAAKWDCALTQYFAYRHVVILPDADRPGRAHAQKVAKAIHGVAASVRILDLYPERDDGSDVSDFIAKDTAGVRLSKEAEDASPWAPTGSPTGPVDGAELLADVYGFLGRFVAYPSDPARIAHCLWIVHAHAMEAWDSTPRIAFLSAEPGSGKTRALEVSELLVPNPVEAVNVTPAYLFRKVGEGPPTILYDEIDTVFGAKAKDNEEIRGLLNAGHRRGAVAGRCVMRGQTVETEEIPAYCAVALAGLGWLPDTLMSRSIVIRMRRRSPSEAIEPYRRRDEVDKGHELRNRLAVWAEANIKILYAARPAFPRGIEDRNADVWEALFAIADAAGGDWPNMAREAAVTLLAAGREKEPSFGISLLTDLRTVFGETEALFTEEILSGLHSMEEAPWKDLNGKGLDSRGLGLRLRQYGIKSKQVRKGTTSKKGYQRAELADAFARYLPSFQMSETSETSETSLDSQGAIVSVVSRAASAQNSAVDISLDESMSVSGVSHVSLLADRASEADHGQVCSQCGQPGGDDVYFSDGQTARLHRECEVPYRRFLDEGHDSQGEFEKSAKVTRAG